MHRKIITPAAVVCLLALGLLPGCGNKTNGFGGSGLIETEDVLVSAETAGRVLERFFDEGSDVVANDTLLIIDPSRLALQLAAAEAQQSAADANLSAARVQLKKAKETEQYAQKELTRVRTLLNSGTATRRQFDQVEHDHANAAIAVEQASAQIKAIEAETQRVAAEINRIKRELRDTRPVAPVGGTVTDDYVETGELLSPGKPIAKIARLDTVWVKIYLSAGDFANVKLGDAATVDTESDLGTLPGTIVWTSEEAEFTPKNVQTEEARADLVYAVKVSIPNPDRALKVGMPVFVTIGAGDE